jgi:GTPase
MASDPTTVDQLLTGIAEGRIAALARAITLVENHGPDFETMLSQLHPRVGKAWRIGITGAPGIGKSTLAQAMVRELRRRGKTVAVVAVDPTSPYTGGALLGDRVRMDGVAQDHGVYIRSMATRGAPGGLATTTQEVCDVLDAYGFGVVLIETVGVGQSELAITATADLAILVLGPESGDGIQMLKAGIMEIADVYVVNKADRPGAEQLAAELRDVLGLRASPAGTGPLVLLTSGAKEEGIGPMVDGLEDLMSKLATSGELDRARRQRLRHHTEAVINRSLARQVWRNPRMREVFEREWDRVAAGDLSVYALTGRVVRDLLGISNDDIE